MQDHRQGQVSYEQSDKLVYGLAKLYLIDFIYSGLLRLILVDSLANVVFFNRAFIVLGLFIIVNIQKTKFPVWINILNLLGTLISLWQISFFVIGKVGAISAFYGWFLYAVPFLTFAAFIKVNKKVFLEKCRKVILTSLIINLAICLMQLLRLRFVPETSGYGTYLQTFDGIPRATGTFSSSLGFGVYIAFCLSFILSTWELKRNKLYCAFSFSIALTLIGISGSRTVIFSTSFSYLVYLIYKFLIIKKSFMKFLAILVTSLIAIVLSYFFLNYLFPDVTKAFQWRFTTANLEDNPLQRLAKIFGFSNIPLSIFGDGLAIYARGNLASLDKSPFYSSWIENDNARILAEGGVLFLIITLLLRFYLILKSLQRNDRDPSFAFRRSFAFFAFPYALFSSVFGQYSVAAGVFLMYCIAIEESK